MPDLERTAKVGSKKTRHHFMKIRFIPLTCLFLVAGTAASQSQVPCQIQREKAIAELEPVVRHPRDISTIVLALVVLESLESKDSIPLAIPLLKHSDPDVQAAAARLIAVAPTRENFQALSDALDSCEVKNAGLASGLGRAFVALEDPASLPALRRAFKRGLLGYVAVALGRVGERDDFELLLGAVLQHGSMVAMEGLMPMVYRSNKPFEVWMSENVLSEKTGLAHKQDWKTWWDNREFGFRFGARKLRD